MIRAVTVAMLVLLACVVGYATIAAPGTVAHRDTCHSTAVTLKSKDSVKARRALALTVSLARTLDHGLNLTVQYRKASSSAWRASGAPTLMSKTPAILTWKAPKVTGKYKLRVKVEWSDDAGTQATYSSVKTVRVY
jgi:hypothetical protein